MKKSDELNLDPAANRETQQPSELQVGQEGEIRRPARFEPDSSVVGPAERPLK